MRCYWEQTGVLGPIYRALGQGLNDRDIAKKLNLTELNVQNCIAWIGHFLNLKSRQDLILHASSAALTLRSPKETLIKCSRSTASIDKVVPA